MSVIINQKNVDRMADERAQHIGIPAITGYMFLMLMVHFTITRLRVSYWILWGLRLHTKPPV